MRMFSDFADETPVIVEAAPKLLNEKRSVENPFTPMLLLSATVFS